MISTDKLIICVAPCGSFISKDANPNIPLQPDEIADEVVRSWNEGAAIAHIHARNKDGIATTDPTVFREIAQKIRAKKCDIIIEFSTSPGREKGASPEDAFKVIEARPEMVSINVGVAVFMREGEERIVPWVRSIDERLTKAVLSMGMKPEFELYCGVGSLWEVNYLADKIPVPKPIWIDFPLDMQRTTQNATPFTPRNLMHLVDNLPQESMFMVLGVGAAETPACVQSILLGGHARVGFEDNLYYRKGVLAKSNAEYVTRIARIGKDLGRAIATPDEARGLLKIPKLGSN